MNIGYKYVKGNVQSDCVIFHDVDHVPEDARHFYVCREEPLHLGAFHSGHDYKYIRSLINQSINQSDNATSRSRYTSRLRIQVDQLIP